jgi:hypothetical protein
MYQTNDSNDPSQVALKHLLAKARERGHINGVYDAKLAERVRNGVFTLEQAEVVIDIILEEHPSFPAPGGAA